jgi:hypothetical protein
LHAAAQRLPIDPWYRPATTPGARQFSAALCRTAERPLVGWRDEYRAVRVTPEEYERIELRAHALLGDVPLHDLWRVELPGGGPGRTMEDIRALLSVESITAANAAVRFLFGFRAWLGRVFGLDREPPRAAQESFIARLSASDRECSLVAPGTPEGPFRVLFVSPREAISEIRNPTVHAFSVFALVERSSGYLLYWGIYVRSVGRITSWYMRLIDPFRRVIIYPAALRHIREAWVRRIAEAAA